MPFSQQNIRFTTLLIGVVMLAAVSVFGIVLIARTAEPPPTLYATALGIPSMIVMQLLHMLRTEYVAENVDKKTAEVRDQVAKTRHDLKGQVGAATQVIEHVAKQLDGDGEHDPSTYVRRDEVELLLEEVALRVCTKVIEEQKRAQG